jgi:hypothetical protein
MSVGYAARMHAEHLLERQAEMTAYTAGRFAEAVRFGDIEAARRWRHAYQRSSACCNALGQQARDGTGHDGTNSGHYRTNASSPATRP